jgi:hypothetical protein
MGALGMKKESGNRLHNRRLLPVMAKAAILLAAAAFAADASAACKRDALKKLTDAYVKAQTAGDVKKLPLDKKASYGENDKAMDATKGVLATARKLDFTRSFYDTTQCFAFTEFVSATDPHPAIILTRMEANKNGKKIEKMESIVTDDGDWLFGAANYLKYTQEEKWDEIPKDKRDKREVIKAAADAYLDNWGAPDLPVPHGTPCARLEGGMYTGTRDPAANSCNMGAFPEKLNVTNRRYVIDEDYGAVVIFHNFPWLDGGIPKDPGTPAGQMFRVEGGKNRYIHELTTCSSPGCGRQNAGGPGRGGQGGAGGGAPRQGGPGGPGGPGGGAPRQGGPGGPGGAGAPPPGGPGGA